MARTLLMLTIIILISCKTSKTNIVKTVEPPKVSLLEGNWKLQMLFASDNTWNRAPEINFNTKENIFSGNSGCNTMRGKFIVNRQDLTFDKNIMSTKMACAEAKSNRDERDFLTALQKINTWSIQKDKLELGQGEIVLMRFTRN